MKQTILLLTTLFGIFSSGCSPIYYSPNTQNVPLISRKGETNLTLAGNANQVEFQGAYGVTNGFALKVNGGFFIPKNNDNGDGGSGKFFEMGGGYYKPLDNDLVFETYGIVGFGTIENHFPSTVLANPLTKGNISANVLRFGIQPNFGFKSKYFSAAISSRITNLTYSNVTGDLIYNKENQLNYLNSNKSNFLIEPALTVKAGLEKIKLQLQLGHSFNLSNSDFKQDKDFLTIALNFNFK
jgi:hypothetical protein